MNAAKERLAAARLTRKFAEQRGLSYSNHQHERTIYCTLVEGIFDGMAAALDNVSVSQSSDGR